jgi:hypothetical protein
MKFEPGNQLAKRRKTRAGGRPSNQSKKVQKAALEIAREYIEASVKPVMMTYFQLAHGRLVNKYHEGKIVGQEFEADAATTRHFIDKILPTVTKIEGKIEVPYSREAVETIRSTPEGRELAMKVSQMIVEKLLLEKPAIDVGPSTED